MKLLQLISCAQLVALVYLAWIVIDLEQQINSGVRLDSPNTQPSPAIQKPSVPTVGYLDAHEIEKLHSELALLRQELKENANVSPHPFTENQEVVISSLEQVSAVDQSIDYYINIGEIDPDQMNELQASIVKLDESNRKEMFKKLFRALNNGRIKGLL